MRRAGALLLALVMPACARPAAGPAPEREYERVGPLELSALVERDLTDVLGSVDVMNTGREPVRVEYAGQCALAIVLHEPGAAAPSWDSALWWASRGDCPTHPMTIDLPPRTLARIVAPLLEAERIRGDTLPGATYRAFLRVRLLQPRDTTLLLPAGDVHLGDPGGASLAAARYRAYP